MSVGIQKLRPRNDDKQKSLRYYLRYELNEDCLVELCEYLHVHDLMQICDLDTEDDQYFTVLIRERVIGRKLIDLEPRNKRQKVWSFTKTFETFGPYIKRLKIPLRSNHFNYILRKIITHSAPGTLTEVQFMSLPSESHEDVEVPVNCDLLQQVIPYFSKVKTVLIEDEWSALWGFYSIFLNSSNVKSLKMIKVNGGKKVWSELATIDHLNLTELKVVECISGQDLAKFIAKLPHLEVFNWHGRRDCAAVGMALVKNCPKLKVYGEYCENRSDDPHYYDFLGHFQHLIQVTLTSKSTTAHDLKSTLQILSRRNQVKQLTLYQSDAKMVEPMMIDEHFFEYSHGFSSLKTILFHFYDHSATIDFEQRQPFFRNLLSSMHGLEKMTMISGSYVFNIPRIIQFTPRIQEISINQQRLFHMPAEVRRIRKFIQKIADERQNDGTFKPVRIIMNAEQAREFLVLKNIEQIVTIMIKDEHEDRAHFGYTMM
ncbi:uncharacterized protein LOC129573184 isoform X2 [Sitodiplosis mosellana]|nr:uncharacterized protein LOC129573184 isoform X2 [Sitodiplosis mosellana]